MISFSEAEGALAAQPFSRLLGTRLTRLDVDGVTLALDLRDDLRQQQGFIHGGVLSYLADNAITFACALGLGRDTVTSGLSVEYLSPAREGAQIEARARLLHTGRTKAVASCEIAVISGEGSRSVSGTALGTCLARRRQA